MRKTRVFAMVLLLLLPLFAQAQVPLSEYAQQLAERPADLIDGDVTYDITWLGKNYSGHLPIQGSALQQIIEKRFNVRITNVQVDTSDVGQMNILLATGAEFDIHTDGAQFASLAHLGSIRPLDKRMVEEYAPTLTGFLKTDAGEDWDRYARVDDVLYGIPRYAGTWTVPIAMGIRKDWFEAVGGDINHLPETLDDLEALLLRLVRDDPDGNGLDDTHALGAMLYHSVVSKNIGVYEMGALNTTAAYWYATSEGEPVYYAIDENYREALHRIRRWFELGIYDPDVVIAGRNGSIRRLKDNKIAGFYGIDWMFHALEAGYDHPEMVLIPPVGQKKGTAGKTSQMNAAMQMTGTAFGRNTSDGKLIRLLQILDAFYTDLDLWNYLHFGEPGIMHTMDDAGHVAQIVSNAEVDTLYGRLRFGEFANIPKSFIPHKYDSVRLKIYDQIKDYPTIEPYQFANLQTQKFAQLIDATRKIQDEFFWKAVTGEIDIDAAWDAYVQEWKAAGGEEMILEKKALRH